MSKNTCQQNSEIALKKAIQQDKWILLIGGTCKERERLSYVDYHNKEIVKCDGAFCRYINKSSRVTEQQLYDYDRIFPNRNKFVLLDVAGCSSEEMSRQILGPDSEDECKLPNDLLRNKPILNVLIQERLLFIDNFCCKNEDYANVVEKVSAQLRMYKSDYQGYKLGPLIIGVESKKNYETLPQKFVEFFTPLSLEIGIDYEVEEQKEEVCRKKGRLQRGKKQKNIPDTEFIPYVKKNLLFLRSVRGGNLTGKDLHEKMQQDLIKRFDKYGDKAELGVGTIRNLISDIDTGKIDTEKK